MTISRSSTTEETGEIILDYLLDDGKLDVDEYRELLCKVVVLDEDLLQGIISKSDTDGDGLLSVNELANSDAFNFEFVHYEKKRKWKNSSFTFFVGLLTFSFFHLGISFFCETKKRRYTCMIHVRTHSSTYFTSTHMWTLVNCKEKYMHTW